MIRHHAKVSIFLSPSFLLIRPCRAVYGFSTPVRVKGVGMWDCWYFTNVVCKERYLGGWCEYWRIQRLVQTITARITTFVYDGCLYKDICVLLKRCAFVRVDYFPLSMSY